jgi:hypothetical protein
MRRTADRLGFLAFGLLLPASLVVVFASRPPDSPSQEECVALWNSRRNATLRAEVAVHGYSAAEIEGASAEGRYQGCFASFAEAIGEPWALYSASRIPGQDRSIRWVLDLSGDRWGIDFPEPEPPPEPNALVLSDGSLHPEAGKPALRSGP